MIQIFKYLPLFYSSPFMGNEDRIRKKLTEFIDETQIDELMVTSYIFDMEARLKSYEILKRALN